MTRKVRLVAVVKEDEVKKLRAVAEETSFERLMVKKKNMKMVKMTMKMRVNLRAMRVKTQSLKVKIQVVRSTISIR